MFVVALFATWSLAVVEVVLSIVDKGFGSLSEPRSRFSKQLAVGLTEVGQGVPLLNVFRKISVELVEMGVVKFELSLCLLG